ncbi:cache domain-containing protein [Paraburkholderia caribensis]|uniref:Cache domain-containing protein n=1 Tax=Paraburkholderia caribensis TaxID=75105 RepID=A0ABV0DPG8_9BURK|nr:cache domain-containing protein [Paraburkholderia caribensis]MCO4878253.1 cache domain-containing protein [Paraburkholderia caribensis]PTB28644.1 hypothetical protein C9I56_11600 [Paraburkholderia caribensis]
MAARNPGVSDALAKLARKTSQVFDDTFQQLDQLASVYCQEARSALDKGLSLTAEDFARAKSRMIRTLSSSDPVVSTMGILVDSDVIKGLPYWLDCIERDPDGAIHAAHNESLPWRESFYEYLTADWMSVPRSEHVKYVAGPYVDLDRYLISLSVPILVDDDFLGVVVADIRLDDFERMLAPLLSKANFDCAVLNADNRVLVSNSASFPVGELVDSTKLTSIPCSDVGWYVAAI